MSGVNNIGGVRGMRLDFSQRVEGDESSREGVSCSADQIDYDELHLLQGSVDALTLEDAEPEGVETEASVDTLARNLLKGDVSE